MGLDDFLRHSNGVLDVRRSISDDLMSCGWKLLIVIDLFAQKFIQGLEIDLTVV